MNSMFGGKEKNTLVKQQHSRVIVKELPKRGTCTNKVRGPKNKPQPSLACSICVDLSEQEKDEEGGKRWRD